MKNKSIDLDDDIDFSEEAFKKRFRRVEGDELVELKERIAIARGARKSRITIYFDTDIVENFKEIAQRSGAGYQTLMNEALRQSIEGRNGSTSRPDVKEEILNDKKFLKRLRKALAI